MFQQLTNADGILALNRGDLRSMQEAADGTLGDATPGVNQLIIAAGRRLLELEVEESDVMAWLTKAGAPSGVIGQVIKAQRGTAGSDSSEGSDSDDDMSGSGAGAGGAPSIRAGATTRSAAAGAAASATPQLPPSTLSEDQEADAIFQSAQDLGPANIAIRIANMLMITNLLKVGDQKETFLNRLIAAVILGAARTSKEFRDTYKRCGFTKQAYRDAVQSLKSLVITKDQELKEALRDILPQNNGDASSASSASSGDGRRAAPNFSFNVERPVTFPQSATPAGRGRSPPQRGGRSLSFAGQTGQGRGRQAAASTRASRPRSESSSDAGDFEEQIFSSVPDTATASANIPSNPSAADTAAASAAVPLALGRSQRSRTPNTRNRDYVPFGGLQRFAAEQQLFAARVAERQNNVRQRLEELLQSGY
jgi:hypothetical protein